MGLFFNSDIQGLCFGAEDVKAVYIGSEQVWPVGSLPEWIEFADPEVLRVLLAKGVNKDGDGGITEGEAAAVTSIGTWFKENTEITSFDELDKFTLVKKLTAGAFQGCTKLSSINLSNIEKLENYVFLRCSSLGGDIKIPKLKGIITNATFQGTNITSITDLGEITGITNSSNSTEAPFGYITTLNKVVIPDTLETFGGYVFYGCTSLSEINFPNAVKAIGAQAFYNCTSLEIEDLALPNLESLGQNAFYGVKIKKMVLGKEGGNLTLPVGSDSTQNYGNKSVLEEIELHGVTSIPRYSFIGYTKMGIILPQSITSIGEGALRKTAISGVVNLPNLTSLSSYAFCSTKITKVANLGQIPSIGAYTFQLCSQLKEIVLPSSLTSIANYAFSDCGNNANIVVVINATTPPSMGASPFSSTGVSTIYVPDASVTAYREASGWSAYADRIRPMSIYNEGGLSEQITFEDPAVSSICLANFDYNGNGYISKAEAASVTSLGTVFKNNTDITSFNEFELFTGVKDINTAPFVGCDNLTSIKLPQSIETLGYNVFNGLKGLKDVELPNLKKIGNGVFRGSSIERVINLGQITRLGGDGESYLFYQCKSLRYIELPETLKAISYRAICGITDLTIVCRAIEPPTGNATVTASRIYVPDESYGAYIEKWSNLADKIMPLSEYVE